MSASGLRGAEFRAGRTMNNSFWGEGVRRGASGAHESARVLDAMSALQPIVPQLVPESSSPFHKSKIKNKKSECQFCQFSSCFDYTRSSL